MSSNLSTLSDTEFLKLCIDYFDSGELIELLDIPIEDVVDAFSTEILYEREYLEELMNVGEEYTCNDDDEPRFL